MLILTYPRKKRREKTKGGLIISKFFNIFIGAPQYFRTNISDDHHRGLIFHKS